MNEYTIKGIIRIHEKEYVIKGTETKYIIPLINI